MAAAGIGCGGHRDEEATDASVDANDVDSSEADGSDGASSDDAASDGGNDLGDVLGRDLTSDELVIFPAQFVEEGVAMRMLSPGDPVDLWNAPQGGHVVLLGAKIANLTSDTANIRARFRRPDTGLIVAEEGRTVKMVPVPGEPGLMQPDIRSNSQVSNVPLCPSYEHLGIVDETFDVELRVTALYTQPVQVGEATIRVVARCSTPDDETFCRCDCGPDYVLGKCWDAGRRPGPPGPPDAAVPRSGPGSPQAD
jgi:hypothetical protein